MHRVSRRDVLRAVPALAFASCRRSAMRVIRIATLPRFTLAPLYVADELGFFSDAGLRLDVQPLTETTQMVPLLAAGQIDVTFAGATPALFNAVAQGGRARIVAARDMAVAGCTQEVHGHRASFPDGFTSADQLRGKRVAVTAPTGVTAFLLDALLESRGLQTNDVRLTPMRLSESAPALVAGRIDAVVDLDMGFSSPEVIPGPAIATIIPNYQYSFMQFGRALLDDPGAGIAFTRAYLRGVHEFRAGKTPRAMDDLARGSGMDPDAVRAACRDRLPEDGAIDDGTIERMLRWSMKKGFTRARVEADQVIDRRFLHQARA